MSETLTKIIVDCSTGIVAEVPLTGEEIAQREVDAAQAEVERAERTTQAEALATLKASAKAKLVAGQPLTTEEAAVLVI
jgi:hypothetical protein